MNLHPAASCAHSHAAQSNRSCESNSSALDASAGEGAGDFLTMLLSLIPGGQASGGSTAAIDAAETTVAPPAERDKDANGNESVAAALLFVAAPPLEAPRVSDPNVNGGGKQAAADVPSATLSVPGTENAAAPDQAARAAAPDASAKAGCEELASEPMHSYTRTSVEAESADAKAAGAFHVQPAILDTAAPGASAPAPDTGVPHTRRLAEPKETLAGPPPREPAVAAHDPVRPAPPLPDQIRDQFSENLHRLREQGRVELHMDLHPPELGRMRLHLTMEANELRVRMHVDNDAAKAVLDHQLEPLRVRFADMGVSLGQLDVRQDGGAPQQDHAQRPEGSEQSALPWRDQRPLARNAYVHAASSDALVDVIA